MHVLYLPSWYPSRPDEAGGSFFREQAIAFSEAGHRVGVIDAWRLPLNIFRRPQRNPHPAGDGINYISRAYWLPPKLRGLQDALTLRAWGRLYADYETRFGRPDILHAHSLVYGGIAASRISQRTGVPFVVTEHSSKFNTGSLPARLLAQSKVAARNAAGRYAVSTAFAGRMSEYVGGEWDVIPNMIADKFFETPIRQRVQQEPFTFLSVGALNPGKRVDLTIGAFIEASIPNSKLLIVGDGPERDKLRALASPAVEFFGRAARGQVVDAMARANCFVQSSDHETFGVAVGEALASGLPVITTESGGPSDLVNGANGYVVGRGDKAAMAAAMRTIGHTTMDRDAIRADCRERFGKGRFSSRLVAAYEAATRRPDP